MSLTPEKHLPIGIFDSGMGGLTVLRALKQLLPNEHFVYLGDTARLPYGTKSVDTVRSYALNANEHLVKLGIKALVVACNTASSVALEALQEAYPKLPIIGVISPGVEAAIAEALPQGPLVVLATEGTVKSQAYSQALSQKAPNRTLIEWPCPLLVALAEEGWHSGDLVEQILKQCLLPLEETMQTPAAGYLLGCTHFPVLKSALQSVVGKNVPLIDPAEQVSQSLRQCLSEQDLLQETTVAGESRFLATDGIDRFVRVAPQFLGHDINLDVIELVTVSSAPMHGSDMPFSDPAWIKPLPR